MWILMESPCNQLEELYSKENYILQLIFWRSNRLKFLDIFEARVILIDNTTIKRHVIFQGIDA